MAGAGHRSTLKQKNKSHNHGKHRSKRNLKREAHGKTTNVKDITKKKKIKELLRSENAQRHADGREESFDQRRGATVDPPRLVVVASLDKNIDVPVVINLLQEADLSAEVKSGERNVLHVSAPKLKKRMCFVVAEHGNLQGLLDAARTADVVLFLMSGDRGLDNYGNHCLTCVVAQGVPAHLFACQGLSNLSKKKLSNAKKMVEKEIEKRFPGEKCRSIDTWQDAQNLWRQMTNLPLKPVHFRDSRPYLLAEKIEFLENLPNETGASEVDVDKGTLKVTGFLRGQDLNVNQLVHIPGVGDFQMSQIDQLDDPYPLVVKGNKDRRQKNAVAGDTEMAELQSQGVCLARATQPESLQSEVIPDDMDQEQTWPTAEELNEDKPVKQKNLKGVSDYQSNWILDLPEDEDDSDDEDADEDMEDEGMEDGEDSDNEEDEEEADDADTGTATETDDAENYDEQMDMDEEKKMYEKMKEERLNVHFPDEVDTPLDTKALTRFARYRGMDSFQTTVWDPKESLAYDYGRIYRVNKHHYKRLKKVSMKEREEEDDNLLAEPGNYITVYIKNVPRTFYGDLDQMTPVTFYGLFANEQKMTLLNVQIARAPGFSAPVKSKEPMVFQVGFRRFSASPIFSEHSYQNKFKMERFLPKNGFIVASMYAPIMFAPAPVLVFRENALERFDLVAKGSLLPLDTDRIVIKRVVLSGVPFKINKKSVVVRYMFFNREDIEFYKPIELRTKHGKRGHIKQALGTHGHMKCTFNSQLKSEDTVLMHLYKRVFPKWSYDPQVPILPPVIVEDEADSQEEEEEMADEVQEKVGDAYKMFD
ncbi:pre-rRNA-processing protein TSR1 homolog [Aplysia californica]|uniref:Pre-rRNA-processing protein TSR1 homolog n=1 Tax=Aplysia californica TaxID=6500 RepID=A0ABM1ADX6_APLCA|nr:pre-rRNA-processing protein TSR1 homolog [Aplysia californica]